jgi:hypothetical protein
MRRWLTSAFVARFIRVPDAPVHGAPALPASAGADQSRRT